MKSYSFIIKFSYNFTMSQFINKNNYKYNIIFLFLIKNFYFLSLFYNYLFYFLYYLLFVDFFVIYSSLRLHLSAFDPVCRCTMHTAVMQSFLHACLTVCALAKSALNLHKHLCRRWLALVAPQRLPPCHPRDALLPLATLPEK